MHGKTAATSQKPVKKATRKPARQPASDQPVPLDDFLRTPYSSMCSVMQLTPDSSPTVNPASVRIIESNETPAESFPDQHPPASYPPPALPSLDLDLFFRESIFHPSSGMGSQVSYHMDTQDSKGSDPDTETDDEASERPHQHKSASPKSSSKVEYDAKSEASPSLKSKELPGSTESRLSPTVNKRAVIPKASGEHKDEPEEGRLCAPNKRRNWSREDDVKLCMAIGIVGKDGWRAVARMVGDHRTPDQCCQRWHRALNPGITRGDWTPEEDARLRESVEGHNGRNWRDVAAVMAGRTDQQCRYRYRQLLKGSRVSQRAAHARRDYVDRVVLGRSNEEITVWHLRPPPSVAALSALAQTPESCPSSLPMTPAQGLEADPTHALGAPDGLFSVEADIQHQESPLTPSDIAHLVRGMQMPARVEPPTETGADAKPKAMKATADASPRHAAKSPNPDAAAKSPQARDTPGKQQNQNQDKDQNQNQQQEKQEGKKSERKKMRVQSVAQPPSVQSTPTTTTTDSPRDARMSLHHILN